MAVQERLEIVDITLVDGALREHHDIDTVDLVSGCDYRAAYKIQIESFRRRDLEEPERLLGCPVRGALHRAEIGLAHSQRPGQQQQVGVPGPRVRTRTTDWYLVPPRLYAWTMYARVA